MDTVEKAEARQAFKRNFEGSQAKQETDTQTKDGKGREGRKTPVTNRACSLCHVGCGTAVPVHVVR